MFKNLSTGTHAPRPATGLLAWACVLGLTMAIIAAGCEDNGLGRACEIRTDAGALTATQAAFNTNAVECPSHICTKPAVQSGIAIDKFDTGAYCTIQCNSDSDCNGQTRDFSNPLDTRCKQGFTCAIPFDAEKLSCMKLCYCRDFLGPTTCKQGNIYVIPASCQSGSDASCP